MVELRGGQSSRPERGVRLLRFATCAGFDFEVPVDRGFDIGCARQPHTDLEIGALTGSETLKEITANASELAAAGLAGALA